MAATHLADFHGYPIEIVDHQGKPWLKAEQIGFALGYKSDNARKGINKLYSSHAEEFTSEMTGVVDMATPGGTQKVRIFSPRGAWMLGMWAQTERAKLFRQWVLDVLEKQTQPEQLTGLDVPTWWRQQQAAVKQALLTARPDYAKLIRYTELELQPAEIAKLLGISPGAVRHRQIRLEKMGLLQRSTNPVLVAAGRKGNRGRQLALAGGAQ